MININILRDNKGKVVEYEIEGHANYDEHGKDIICAAISVLSQTTLIALNKVCGIDEQQMCFSVDNKKGYLKVSLAENLEKEARNKADIVLETMIVGIEDLSDQYPQYINFKK